jgi:non-homologous end joining protein Ku
MKTVHGRENSIMQDQKKGKKKERREKKGRRRTNENRIKLKGSLRRSVRKNKRKRDIW